jgi:sugar lactone lactonase YvrE
VDAKGKRTEWPKPEGGQLDGIVRDASGAFWVSGWEKSAVYELTPGIAPEAKLIVRTAIEGVTSPADLGIDLKRGRLLIPLFTLDQLEIRDLPQPR